MAKVFFEEFADEFKRGKLNEAASRFSYPTAIYISEETLLLHRPSDFVRTFSAYRTLLASLGYCSTSVKVSRRSPLRGKKHVVSVDWQHMDEEGFLIERSSIKFFCCEMPDGDFRIQLAEYEETPDVFWSDVHQKETVRQLEPA